jgi:hypothetical protein
MSNFTNGNDYKDPSIFGKHPDAKIDLLLSELGRVKHELKETENYWESEILRYKKKIAELYEWKLNMIEFNAMYDEKEPNPVPRKDGHLPHPDEWEDEDSDEDIDSE